MRLAVSDRSDFFVFFFPDLHSIKSRQKKKKAVMKRILALLILSLVISGCAPLKEMNIRIFKVGKAISSFADDFMTRFQEEAEDAFNSLSTNYYKYEVIIVDG